MNYLNSAQNAIGQIKKGYTICLITSISIGVLLFVGLFFTVGLIVLTPGLSGLDNSDVYKSIMAGFGAMEFLIFGLLALAACAMILIGYIMQISGLEKLKAALDTKGVEALKKIILGMILTIATVVVGIIIPFLGVFLILPLAIAAAILTIMGYNDLRNSEVLNENSKGTEGTKKLLYMAIFGLTGGFANIIPFIGGVFAIVLMIMSIVYFYSGWKLILESFEERHRKLVDNQNNTYTYSTPTVNIYSDGQDM